MITTFFDLPSEIRKVIWRKARYQSALYNIKQKFIKPDYKIITNNIRLYSIIYIRTFHLNSYKTMSIEAILYKENENDTLIVDITDSTYIKILLSVQDDKIKVYFGTNYNKRSFNYRKVTVNSIINCQYKNKEVYQCLYK